MDHYVDDLTPDQLETMVKSQKALYDIRRHLKIDIEEKFVEEIDDIPLKKLERYVHELQHEEMERQEKKVIEQLKKDAQAQAEKGLMRVVTYAKKQLEQ